MDPAGKLVLAPATASHRYAALDALRGICALCVCLFHFRAAGPIAVLPFVHGSWLFVDFFFVLSGFVIAASYRERLLEGGFLRRFVVLRFGRVYPLHIFMLFAFIAFEFVGMALQAKGLMHRAVFEETTSVAAILTHQALLHSFGLHSRLTWNGPSWSISAEFWTYVLFAVAAQSGGKALDKWLLAAVVVCVAVLLAATPFGINVSYSWSLFRCIYGFAVGVIAWRWWSKHGLAPQREGAGGTAIELLAVAVVIAFVSLAGATRVNLMAPLLFGVALLVFAREAGAVSQVLKTAFLQWLGLLSYSIYMVHAFIQARFDDGLRLVGAALHVPLTTRTTSYRGLQIDLAGATSAQGVALTLLMLVVVIAVAALTQRYVERPGQQWARRIADALPSGARVAKERS